MQELLIETHHARLAVIDHGGGGPDEVLLHGANGNPWNWVMVTAHLRDLRIVAIEFGGMAHSSDEGAVGPAGPTMSRRSSSNSN